LDIQAGVYVTIIGMALVFAALAILMLAIMALNRIFPPREESVSSTSASKEVPGEQAAIVAAIAVSLALASGDNAEYPAPQPVHILSIRRVTGAWKAHSKLHSTE